MTPYLGKGATCALEDAISLAQALQNGASNGSIPDHLHKYETEMLSRGFAQAKQSMNVHRMVFNYGSNRWVKWCRDYILSWVDVLVGRAAPPFGLWPVSYEAMAQREKEHKL
ncbi:MAG: hypothetical protein Q9227_007466 [Pyrenula ochraceoflavens]